MAWCRTVLWFCLLATMYERRCSALSSFSRSLSLTRAVRSNVQNLLLRYKEEQFGDKHFDDKRIVLNTLPPVTINYRMWLQMEDAERLFRASRDLQLFWSHLESQRQKLQGNSEVEERAMNMKPRNRRGRPLQSLSQSILGIQLDLRDLIRQVNSQLLSMSTSNTPPPTSTLSTTISSSTSRPSASPISTSTASPPGSTRSALDLILSITPRSIDVQSVPRHGQREPSPGPVQQKPDTSRWMSVLEGYVILRDLDRYLCRLVRDYTLLRAKS
ncbi:uncharacterized protein LOC113650951 [Tachysurus fulvidraco]|uniref:uncharacterized protein LOC113650951 n=1 Tax=Tachysurus fulvidraco TaxID=1234273 RepID=UPI000F4FA85F|nr:uncharacterized protein LOC113650951 [Tachysurus fulvidraco]